MEFKRRLRETQPLKFAETSLKDQTISSLTLLRGRRESGERGKVEEATVKQDDESVKQKGSVKNIGYVNSAHTTGRPFK